MAMLQRRNWVSRGGPRLWFQSVAAQTRQNPVDAIDAEIPSG